jgi:hypothetical protein
LPSEILFGILKKKNYSYVQRILNNVQSNYKFCLLLKHVQITWIFFWFGKYFKANFENHLVNLCTHVASINYMLRLSWFWFLFLEVISFDFHSSVQKVHVKNSPFFNLYYHLVQPRPTQIGLRVMFLLNSNVEGQNIKIFLDYSWK